MGASARQRRRETLPRLVHEEDRHVDEGSSQRWAGDRGERPLPRLLLVLLPIGSYREVGSDLTSRAGTAPKGLAEIRGHLGCYRQTTARDTIQELNELARRPPSARIISEMRRWLVGRPAPESTHVMLIGAMLAAPFPKLAVKAVLGCMQASKTV